MKIRERKRIKYFLEMLKGYLEENDESRKSSELFNFFTRAELIEVIKWLDSGSALAKSDLENMETHELTEVIGSDHKLLSFVLEKWNAHLTAKPTMSQEEVHSFFRDRMGLNIHYLSDKPVEEWDEYDCSNYYSLLFKHGVTKRVFAIFTSEVNEEDKYAVTTQPSFFFDTKEEAEAEVEKLILERSFSKRDLKIMSVWKIN